MLGGGESGDIGTHFSEDALDRASIDTRNGIQALDDGLVGGRGFSNALIQGVDAGIEFIEMSEYFL
jgi:hypothetical protein